MEKLNRTVQLEISTMDPHKTTGNEYEGPRHVGGFESRCLLILDTRRSPGKGMQNFEALERKGQGSCCIIRGGSGQPYVECGIAYILCVSTGVATDPHTY
jgi:hypothetical protein